ncbi:RNA polymerase-binding protein DksA [Helicobacter sp. MIT 05-5293]|uniref:Molecular chaperone DnaK suppressor DksA n=1 Tax=uncultured Helicobacter sp. TaxID=175537 RepID=A0A650EKC2_9HELI|nr:RNA polymerase-binding protein DksA [Helicobacter sp. MIT 05-5293]QGT50210.1 molecular chaperone DnaK suppressor DksA [uncultured Helicobacter sp.]TLD80824.1 RNA polymerase-binding protein DksA [Helicobacter sp. MIT 05-5293]
MIDYSFFESLLKERLHKICQSIDTKNSRIKSIQDTHFKDENDMVSAFLQGNLAMSVIDLYHAEMSDIQRSLQKIKEGVYGICEMCDDEIDVERLKVKPHAKYCIKCRELFEKNQKQKG